MKKTILTILAFFMVIGFAVAQTNVTGVVRSADDGQPVSFATVTVKGTSASAYTDDGGRYTIAVPDNGKVLVFSFIGLKNLEIEINNRSIIDVTMQPEDNVLEESIITAYGTIKKSAYAGSASTVKTESLQDVPAVSFSQMLSGNAAGVTVNPSSGQPGAPTDIRIRGIGSFNASKSPLYVVDGVPVISGDISAVSSSNAGIDVMSTLNNADIESISVIKDAAAASLYGSRAANGVIIITTKSGKKGKASFGLKTDMGFSNFAMDYRTVMNGVERRETQIEGYYNEYILKGKSHEEAMDYAMNGYIDSKGKRVLTIEKTAPVPWNGYADWDDILFRTGFFQNHEASVSGGSDSFKYYSSIAYTNQEGVTRNSGLERIGARLNVDYNATKKLSLGVKSLFSALNQETFSESMSYTSPFYSSRNAVVPSDPVYNEDGTYNRNFIRNSDRNPKLAMDYNYNKQHINRAFNTVYGQYEFIEKLRFRSTFSYDYTLSKGDQWYDPRTSDGKPADGAKAGGSRYKRYVDYRKLVWSNTLGYDWRLGDNHYFDALVAYDVESYDKDYLYAGASVFPIPDKDAISNGVVPSNPSGYPTTWRMSSFISRLNYNYEGKYYAGASFRTDGSSRLHEDSRWGNFWSISGAWRVSQEDFMRPIKDVLSDLRLRVSYGVNGTLPSEYYGYYGLSSLGYGYNGEPGIRWSQLENYDLQWETNYNFNAGIDIGLFNRVNLTLEVYDRTTKNLLMDFPISGTTGFTSYLANVGEVRNRGIEAEISSTNIQTKDFTWTTSFNIGSNKNKILKLDGTSTEMASGNQIRKIGLPYITFYLYEFAGINPENGEAQFYLNTKNSDGSINRGLTEDYTKAERIVSKSFDPKVTGGLTNTFSYKWIDFNFLLTYSFGGWGYDNAAQKTEHGGADMQSNIPAYYKDRWKKPGDNATYERFVANREVSMYNIASTRRLHSTDFVRLKNLTLGVTLPKQWAKKASLDRVRLFCSGINILTWADSDIYDPESVDSDGTSSFGQPPLKTWTFGIEVKF